MRTFGTWGELPGSPCLKKTWENTSACATEVARLVDNKKQCLLTVGIFHVVSELTVANVYSLLADSKWFWSN